MDYCSLCRKACLVKDFWKIYIGLILSLLLKWTFYPQRHMILSSADSFCQKADYLLFYCLLPLPFQSFKWIPLDSKRYPDFAKAIFSVHLYVWYFFIIESRKNFKFSQVYLYRVWNVKCMALLCYWSYDGVTFMIFGHFSNQSCHRASLVHCHRPPPPQP